MSVDARQDRRESGPLPAIPAAPPGAPDKAGVFYARLTVLPALLAIPFLLTSFPLLLLGWFEPVPVIVAWLVLAAVVVPFAWRRIPSVAGGLGWGSAGGRRTPGWSLAALVAVAVVFGAGQAVFHSQFIIVMLDAASYTQFAFWISHHGSLPILQHAAAFGGAPGISFDSPAFYQVGHDVVPQFMAGLPMVLSLGYWAGGVKAVLGFGPLLGAGAVFTFGGLAARLVGPRWGWVGALVIGVSLPEEFTSRSTYSEPLSQILLLGGLALWIDSQRTGSESAGKSGVLRAWRGKWLRATNVLALLAGLALGINLLVRIDAPSDILLAVPFCGLLVLQRRRQVVPLIAGLIIGLAYGTVDGLVLSRPYLRTNITSVEPMTEAFAAAVVVTALVVAVLLLRGRGAPRPHPRLIDAVTVLPFLALIAFVARPYVQKDWAALKYAPISLHWVYWYVGGPIILFAVIAGAMLSRRCLRGQAPTWILPLLVFAWTIPEFLYRPAIVPHNPYASRRIVPAVLPGLVLLALWLCAWAIRKMRAAQFDVPPALRRVPVAGVTLACAIALIVPPFQATFGLKLASSDSRAARHLHGISLTQGTRLVSDGLAFKRTYSGEVAAVNELCRSIPANSSVLFVDTSLGRELLQNVRGMCGVPTARVSSPGKTLTADIRAIQRAGRHPVVFSATHKELSGLHGGTTTRVVALHTAIDVRQTVTPPHNVDPVDIIVYRWEPGS